MFDRKFFVTREQLSADYALLKSSIAIARKYGVSKKLVLRYMTRWGIARREPTPWIAVKALADQGKTAKEIGAKLGIRSNAVCQIARKNGFSIRDSFHQGVIDRNGYRLVRRPDHPNADSKGYVPEHRLVAEQALGRFLLETEVPHHLNGVKDDNRPENISVMSDFDHRSLHRSRGDCGRKKRA